MKLTSSAFQNDETIPAIYTCEGKDINPPLEIRDVPSGTKSLTLILDDPDVPPSVRVDRMWDHWVVFNIPPDEHSFPENCHPKGTLGRSTSGRLGYEGPCPPDREHRYFFKVYALDCVLSLSEGATKIEVEKAMKKHILASATLMGRYEKRRAH